LTKKPRIDWEEKKELMITLFHMGYITGGQRKWVLTMKGQQILIMLNELKKRGHVEKIDSRFMERKGLEKLVSFLIDIIVLRK